MKLSVIVPCYNVAPFLDRAMRCLTNQSLTDLEIICIDDKSTDNTVQELHRWARNDLRIRIIENKKNIGVGPTRNRGLDVATGEYIGFMDPDDFIDTEFFERLISFADSANLECVCGQLCVVDIDGRKHYDPYRSATELRRTHHNFKYHYTAIYRRDFLNAFQIRYPALSINEDSVFETMVKCAISRPMGFVRGVYYYYCRRAESLNSDYWPEKKIRDSINGIGMILDIYNMRPVSKRDYICGAHGYFHYLYTVTMGKNTQTKHLVATAACELFQKLQFREKYAMDNLPLYLALMNNDPAGVIGVLKAQKWYVRTYSLFGRIKFLTISYNSVNRIVRLFGIKIYSIKLK
ncbi:MAG: glycosyltransferase family 2 protein [Alphaproteobacteria bacterium]|nr:glycosyltransferase family 2 protein [Alphaproteobacteria bacterium]